MKTPPFEPVRFLDLPRQDEVAEAARLIRQVVAAPEAPVPPLKGRIRQTLRRKSASRRRHLRALLVGGAIFVSGGVVGAVVQPILRLREQAKVQTVESGTPSPGRRSRPGRLPGRMPSAGTVPEAAGEAPAMPAAPLPEQSQRETAPASALPGRLPLVPMEPEPVARAAPGRAARSAESQEKVAPTQASTSLRTPRIQGARRHEGGAMPLAMREPPVRAPISPGPAALEPSPLQPPPPMPAPSEVENAAPRPLSPITAAATNAVPAKPAPSPTQPPAGPPPSEQALVASAIRSLRVQRSPGAALAALDQYQARYPKGSMLAETVRLRAEALLLLGQRRAALDELSRAPASGTAADEESRLVHGELAASAGRWQEALQDFDALVIAWSRGARGDTLSPKLRVRFERALWGRACARSHLGNEAGARADLEELLRRFPQGRFAAQAAQRLGEPR